jgi:hypothetical protein
MGTTALAIVTLACAGSAGSQPGAEGRSEQAATGGDNPPTLEAAQPAATEEQPVEEPTEATAEAASTAEASATEEAIAEATSEPTTEATQEPPPQPSAEPVAIAATGGSADSLDTAWATARSQPQGVPFRITTDEATIEAKIYAKMAASGYGSNISDLNVMLDNQQIGMSFTLTLTQPRTISATGSVVFNASIDGNGDLVLSVASATFGQFKIPPEMLTALTEALTEAMVGARSSAEADVTLTELVIFGGQMIIVGYAVP